MYRRTYIDVCVGICFQTQVEVMQLWSDDIETDLANPGENVKIKLKNVEEEVRAYTHLRR